MVQSLSYSPHKLCPLWCRHTHGSNVGTAQAQHTNIMRAQSSCSLVWVWTPQAASLHFLALHALDWPDLRSIAWEKLTATHPQCAGISGSWNPSFPFTCIVTLMNIIVHVVALLYILIPMGAFASLYTLHIWCILIPMGMEYFGMLEYFGRSNKFPFYQNNVNSTGLPANENNVLQIFFVVLRDSLSQLNAY